MVIVRKTRKPTDLAGTFWDVLCCNTPETLDVRYNLSEEDTNTHLVTTYQKYSFINRGQLIVAAQASINK